MQWLLLTVISLDLNIPEWCRLSRSRPSKARRKHFRLANRLRILVRKTEKILQCRMQVCCHAAFLTEVVRRIRAYWSLVEEHLCCHLSELLITFIVLAEIAKPEELDAVVISLRSSDFQGIVSHSIKYFYRLHNRNSQYLRFTASRCMQVSPSYFATLPSILLPSASGYSYSWFYVL